MGSKGREGKGRGGDVKRRTYQRSFEIILNVRSMEMRLGMRGLAGIYIVIAANS